MIAFACATTGEREFREGAAAAIHRVAEADSLLLRRHGHESAASPCNEMLDRAAAEEDLEALVLLAQDVSIEDDDFPRRLRALLAIGPEVAVVGPGDGRGPREVEALGGGLAALSPWAVRELRFDEALGGPLDCGMVDICRQARALGRRVVAGHIHVHRVSRGLEPAERVRSVRAGAALWRKWAPTSRTGPGQASAGRCPPR